MSEAEMNAYRFGSGEEPTDEMLAQIMKEAAEEARISNEEIRTRYFNNLREGMQEQEAKWADRINKIKDGEY